VGYDGADLGRGGDVDPDLEPAALALVDARLAVAPTGPAQVMHHVLRHQSTLLSIGQDGSERAHHNANHDGRAVFRELVFERARHRHRQLRQLHIPDQRCNVKPEMLLVLLDRGSLQLCSRRSLNP
jgi:hypothetical protein